MVWPDPKLWDQPHVIGGLSIKLKDGLAFDHALIAKMFSETDGSLIRELEQIGGHHLQFLDDDAAKNFAAFLVAHGMVDYAEPDIEIPVSLVPNDPGYPGGSGAGGTTQYYLTQINMTPTYDITMGSASVVMGWVDTDFQPTHPDMAGKFVTGFMYLNSTTDMTPLSNDTLVHGCLTSGIAGALTNNNLGIASVAPNCPVRPYACASSNVASPTLSSAFIASAIGASQAAGDKVINMSFASASQTTSIKNACAAAWAAGMVLVGAEFDTGDFTIPYYPAAYPHVLAAGAVDSSDNRMSGTAYGSTVNCAAPGEQLFTTTNYDGGYTDGYKGCSYSAAIISGVVALMWSVNPALTNKNIFDILTSSAGGNPTTGFTNSVVFRVNALKAVQAAMNFHTPTWVPSQAVPVFV